MVAVGQAAPGDVVNSIHFALHQLVTSTSTFDQTFGVEYFHLPTRVRDQTGLLQNVSRSRNRRTLDAEHLCHELLAHRELIGPNAVMS